MKTKIAIYILISSLSSANDVAKPINRLKTNKIGSITEFQGEKVFGSYEDLLSNITNTFKKKEDDFSFAFFCEGDLSRKIDFNVSGDFSFLDALKVGAEKRGDNLLEFDWGLIAESSGKKSSFNLEAISSKNQNSELKNLVTPLSLQIYNMQPFHKDVIEILESNLKLTNQLSGHQGVPEKIIWDENLTKNDRKLSLYGYWNYRIMFNVLADYYDAEWIVKDKVIHFQKK